MTTISRRAVLTSILAASAAGALLTDPVVANAFGEDRVSRAHRLAQQVIASKTAENPRPVITERMHVLLDALDADFPDDPSQVSVAILFATPRSYIKAVHGVGDLITVEYLRTLAPELVPVAIIRELVSIGGHRLPLDAAISSRFTERFYDLALPKRPLSPVDQQVYRAHVETIRKWERSRLVA